MDFYFSSNMEVYFLGGGFRPVLEDFSPAPQSCPAAKCADGPLADDVGRAVPTATACLRATGV